MRMAFVTHYHLSVNDVMTMKIFSVSQSPQHSTALLPPRDDRGHTYLQGFFKAQRQYELRPSSHTSDRHTAEAQLLRKRGVRWREEREEGF